MMTNRKALLITGSFIVALLAVRVIWLLLLASPPHAHAVGGQLDLRGTDFAEDRAIALDGEWAFYPGRLIMREEANGASTDREPTFVQVPGDWRDALTSEGRTPHGYGTYRLRVLIDSDSGQGRTLGIRLSGAYTSSELFVNGRPLARQGHPGESKRDYEAGQRVPDSAYFTADSDVVDIVVQVANYDNDRRGGLVQPVEFGFAEAIEHVEWFSKSLQIAMCVVLLIHAVYACILYLVGNRQPGLIRFFLLVVSTILMTLVESDRLLLVWLPLDYDWIVKLAYMATVGVAAFLLMLAQSLLPEYAKLPVFRWFYAWCVLAETVVLFVPARITLNLALPLFGSTLIAAAIFLGISWRTTVRRDKDAIFLVVGLAAIVTNVVANIARAWIELLDTEIYYPFDLMVAFLAFASFWFKRYFRTAARTERLAAELQKADKLKDDFLANTSHELRNPLHGMLNIAQTVLDTWDDRRDDRNRANMELILSVGRRMTFLINNLLDVNRLQENGIRLRLESVRVQAVASGVVDMLRFMTEGKPIRLVQDIPDDFPPVVADENRLTQIAFNLLHNAVKFTNEGIVSIRAKVEEGRAVVYVADTGIGMDEETQRRVFLPYEQTDHGMTSGGIGLGLSISKQLAELHGGALEISASEPGRGSEFRFSLPLAGADARLPEPAPAAGVPAGDTGAASVAAVAATEAAAAAEAEIAPAIGSEPPVSEDRLSILAVDDDPVNLNVLSSLLSTERYDVVKAGSGYEALSLLDTREWDLIISDVMMPRMSGYELTRTVRERFSVSELPLLLLTARSRPEDVEAGFLSGANDYLTKPVDALELKSRVRALTEMKKSVRERLRMEAAWLQAQIEPHFLFNTLNSVAALSEIDTAKMRKLLEAFSNYLRASFDFRNSDRLVPLEHELGLVRSYLYIEKERFERRLDIAWEVDEGVRQLRIPPLSIQPLVENALRHGILKRAQGGRIRIRIVGFGDGADISVEDDGAGMDEETLRLALESRSDRKRGIGLLNTNRRLKQIYGEGLRIRSRPNEGTVVSFTIFRSTRPWH